MPQGVYKHKPQQGFQRGHKIGVGNKYNAGKKIHTEQHKQELQVSFSGPANPRWKGGISRNRHEYTIKRQEELAGRKKPESCELCGGGGRICFDHDHQTGIFRGWLCTRCNVTLGNVKDSTDLLNAMINYLLQR
jgi:hypothetical protein